MRNTKLLLAGAAAIIAVPAQAREGQPYIGINGGIVFQDQVDVEAEPYSGSRNEARINTGEGWEGDVVIGYDFGAFRLEAEGAYKNQDHDTLFIDGPNTAGLPVGLRTGPDSTQKTYSAMVNALIDIGNDDGLQLYAGGGAGLARVDMELSVPGVGTLIDDKVWRYGLHEAATIRLMRRLLADDRRAGRAPVLLDVGTNTGVHLVACAGLCDAALGCEPWAPMRYRAEASLAASGFSHVRLLSCGLGEASAELPFAVPQGTNLGTGSFATGQGELMAQVRRGHFR
jgi:opacity protein-like surface antigen